MAAPGHRPSAYEGRSVQAPGLLRHGPFSGSGAVVHRLVEPLPPLELLEKKIVIQETEMEILLRENQRLAASHTTLRQELVGNQQEIQRLKSHVGSIQTESDIQLRGMLDKIAKMEADIHTGDIVKKELHQVHMEAQRLLAARQELNAEIQLVTEELKLASNELKKLPEMHAELDGLRQEHKKLRMAFEHEKGSNVELVDRMRSMEMNLMSMGREVEKLRAEVADAEQRANAPSRYGVSNASQDSTYAAAGQISRQPDNSYGQGSGYTGAYNYMGYQYPGYGVPANYNETYGGPQAPMTSGMPGQAANLYASTNGTSYVDAYGRPLVQAQGGLLAADGVNSYGPVSVVGTHDPANPSAQPDGK